MRNKNRQINFRVSDREYEQIHKKARQSKLDVSNYLLNCALGKEIVIVTGLNEFHTELHRIGVNLNQLTKLANENKISCPNLDEMIKEVHGIWQLLNSLTRKAV